LHFVAGLAHDGNVARPYSRQPKPGDNLMRKTLLAAVAAFVIGGVTAGAVLSYAAPEPATPPGPQAAWQQRHHDWMGWRHAMWRHRRIARGSFALIYTQPDRHLTPDDVQKIAEGFLLWHGNHDWKVVDVAPQSDGAIGFSLATQNGSVIAKFSMDPHTGRVTRLS
jgi:hypothetical protein